MYIQLAENSDLVSLKAEADKLDIDKLKSAPTNLSNLKSKVDKFDIIKLESTPVDLIKLRYVVKNEVLQNTEYNAKIKNIEYRISDIINLATKNFLNTKIMRLKLKYQVLIT